MWGAALFLIDEQTDKFRFLEENERTITAGGHPATAQPLLLEITSRPRAMNVAAVIGILCFWWHSHRT